VSGHRLTISTHGPINDETVLDNRNALVEQWEITAGNPPVDIIGDVRQTLPSVWCDHFEVYKCLRGYLFIASPYIGPGEPVPDGWSAHAPLYELDARTIIRLRVVP